MIAPSILSANFANLALEIEKLNEGEADFIHFDVMDGVFVPNISFGFTIIKTIKELTTIPLDVHLMIVNPERYITQFRDAGADILTVHYEASTHLHRTIESIHNAGMKSGVALNPHTPVNLLSEIISEIHLALIMSVNPGFGGQKFIPNSLRKIAELKELREKKDSRALISVDGGVNVSNAKEIRGAGADIIVAGNAIFQSPDVSCAVKQYSRF